jgi:hypothetical protein
MQRAEVENFEKRMASERAARLALRQPQDGLTAGQLLKKMDGDEQDAQKRLDDELEKVRQEAAAVAARKDKDVELPPDHFPPPTIHVK